MPQPFVRIQGAGPVGLLAALFLIKHGWPRDAIEVIDPALDAAIPAHDQDPRVLALSHGTLIRLEQLGVQPNATRIEEIHVSSEGHFGSMQIRGDRVGVSHLGALASYSTLLSTLRQAAEASGLTMRASVDASDQPRSPDITVIAEGGLFQPSATSNDSSDKRDASSSAAMTVVRDYQQDAVLGWVSTTPAPSIRAWERFTEDGAVALLPIRDRYALIWCGSKARTQEFRESSEARQRALLEAVMGGRVTGINSIEITGVYPLGLKWRDPIATNDTVWIGNSAQALHPIAGQGMNLGFRDAEVLATCLVQYGMPIPTRLHDYAARRKADRWAVRTATDNLARAPWVRRAIGGVALVPGAKKLLGQVLMYGG
jgi:2-octaprenyl-6-methoxyphenol hydroxylase